MTMTYVNAINKTSYTNS